ncbi:uncharacterized protein LOC132793933 [Drosophila nasuta]|uniref:uncharacterized protein LOC132793933 n=1 Tax=Drosophila nasuta TaxID=42062 RepID=UPI00295F2A4A|nr:uncharacterized protein LOC132793933 [Drosophila nasuta]
MNMFKSKSFDLNNEENTKRTEHLYQPRRIRWMKYIVIPLTIAFVLLLIVCNIDFSSEQSQTNTSLVESAKWCTADNSCDKNVSNLLMNTNWKDSLLLRLENYNFPEGIISSEVLTTEYSLQSLEVINCSVNYIMDDVFNQPNLRSLLEMELVNTELKNLTKSTFQGLEELRNFTLINVRTSMHCESFMTPLANNLTAATIHQLYSGHSIYKPSDFFGIAIYTSLKSLDLKGNNFGEILETGWFNNMPALKSLSLADCRFNGIDFDINANSFGRLKFLDLSGNQLLRLNAQIVTNPMDKILHLKLAKYSKTATTLTASTVAVAKRAIFEDSVTSASDEDTPKFQSKSTSGSTVPLDTTTVTAAIDDTPPSSDTMDIKCLNTAKDTVSNLSMSCNAAITIVDQAETTINIILTQVDFEDWALVYFSDENDINCVEKEDKSVQFTDNISITVNDLSCATSYVFCLLQDNKTSPLNCLSHHTLHCTTVVSRSSWFEENSVLIISLGTVGILLFVALGGGATYAILWHRPSWLCGSKRLKRAARDSLTMLLLPQNYEHNIYSAIRKENDGDAIGDYMTYYRHLEQTKLYQTESNKYNVPPQESAPPAPNPKGHTYASFDLYEELI